ncbi:precorrin-2 dehydrogenase/sirohydrochlorin ferrochelatase family protein [Megalodesulfovibrio gigas]|uniref:precorrin-2 dehydrogenase n=1 Tax=Megalodesulfovibrio gigas (strain ATCC 19364 / DSM 1382 / NCIMB 9332 / VKM B-1759) TaxID=1121448 RepID=T2GCI9_MEGG1|nr:bifunctional precorrin-2 dehydrogenase/sirohydrochlorin ferrochelatase [Megalodesulfovibrio gigas]AGW14295.1 putative siroheme synthase [Megalodesulfovibrio gigas DSM 1382 = ATCC 19364]
MRYYPLFLNLADRRCIVAGLGDVGRRKCRGLLPAGPASILLLDTAPLDADFEREIAPLLQAGRIAIARRVLADADLDGCFLVFAATGSREENQRIAALCRARGVLCNVVDAPASGDCIVPSLAVSGGLMAAFSTQGQSPALARVVKHELAAALGKWAGLAQFLGLLRPALLELGQPSSENAVVFRSLLREDLADALRRGDVPTALAIVRPLTPMAVHDGLESMLAGSVTDSQPSGMSA